MEPAIATSLSRVCAFAQGNANLPVATHRHWSIEIEWHKHTQVCVSYLRWRTTFDRVVVERVRVQGWKQTDSRRYSCEAQFWRWSWCVGVWCCQKWSDSLCFFYLFWFSDINYFEKSKGCFGNCCEWQIRSHVWIWFHCTFAIDSQSSIMWHIEENCKKLFFFCRKRKLLLYSDRHHQIQLCRSIHSMTMLQLLSIWMHTLTTHWQPLTN